jgi:hypothetical protein
LQDGSYNGHLLCSKWSQLNVEITVADTANLLIESLEYYENTQHFAVIIAFCLVQKYEATARRVLNPLWFHVNVTWACLFLAVWESSCII